MDVGITQELTFETSSLETFVAVLSGVVPLLHSERVSDGPLLVALESSPQLWVDDFPSQTASWFLGPDDGRVDGWRQQARGARPLFEVVCRVTWSRAGAETAQRYETAAEAVGVVEGLVRKADPESFLARNGRGPFASGDGAVRAGYRMHLSSSSMMSGLLISLCHIYLPK